MRATHFVTHSGIFLMLLLSRIVAGQGFQAIKLSKFQAGIEQHAFVAEINNDGFRDLIITKKINTDSAVAFIFLQTNPLDFSLTDTIKDLASDFLFFTDLNNNGQLDMIANVKDPDKIQLMAFLDYNAITGFQKSMLLQKDAISRFAFADINNDGLKDLLLIRSNATGSQFELFLQKPYLSFEWQSSYVDISNFMITSFNGDGFPDLILSDSSNNELHYLTNHNFEKWDTATTTFNKKLFDWQNADVNYDGKADIIIASNDPNSSEILALINKSGQYIEQKIEANSPTTTFVSAGDFTNDGLYDIVVTTDKTQILQLDSTGTLVRSIPIDSAKAVKIYGTGDIDDDGDLDFVGFRNSDDSVEVYLYMNQPSVQNHGPSYVPLQAPVTINEQTTFLWKRSIDDRTPSSGLTYDFYIWSEDQNQYIITSDFGLENTPRKGARNYSRHGYTLFDTLYQVNNLNEGKYFWGIAGVDNAFYSETNIKACGGPCSNKNFVSQCLEITRQDTMVCLYDTLDLAFGSDEDSVVWHSLGQGLLNAGNSIKFPVVGDDEVYAIAIPKFPCDDPENSCVKNYTLSITTNERKDYISEKFNVCQDSINVYKLNGDFEEITWYSSSGILSDSNTVQFSALADSLLFVKLKEIGASCYAYDTLTLQKLKKPEIDFLPDDNEACINKTIPIIVNIPDSLAPDINYSLTANGSPLDINNPEITLTAPVTIILSGVYAHCHSLSDTLTITPVNLPTITITGDKQIFPGQSAQLIASGATNYQWSPEIYLSTPNSASTLAQPPVSTVFQVKGWDIAGCEGQASYPVEVIPSVYIPELFTPNNDGNNDMLIVHGSNIKNLDFYLYDGNGRLVYHSSSPSEITTRGWDGTTNGSIGCTGHLHLAN